MSKVLSPLRFILLAVALLLAGCDVIPKLQLEKTKYVLVKPEDDMLMDCVILPPPDPTNYAKMTLQQREGALYNYGIDSMVSAATCNVQWGTLRDWYAKQKKIYPDVPSSEKK